MEMMSGNVLRSRALPQINGIHSSDIGVDKSLFGAIAKGLRPNHPIKNNIDRIEFAEKVANFDEVDLRVLLVAKEQLERQSICNALSRNLNFSIKYLEAAGGDPALRIIDCEVIDLIIYGDGVVDMDGLEFLGRLNMKCGKSKIPVIEILTSGAEKKGVQAMKMGAHDYLLKSSDGHHFDLLPILVSRVYAEQKTMSALRQTAGAHQSISDNIPSVIYNLSLQGSRHDVCISPQFSKLGISVEKWGNDAELHHQMCYAEDRPIVKDALEHSYKTGTIFQCEYRINTFGETLRWFNDKAKVIMDKYGRPLFLQGVMTDITGLKSLEAEIAQYRSMLDKMVRQKTERLDRRVAILESCNSSLSENYDKMRHMYLDVLAKVQATEGEVGASGAA